MTHATQFALAQTLRPLVVARIAVFLARLRRRKSLAHAAMLAAAMVSFRPVRPVSQHNAGLQVATALTSPQPANEGSRFWIGFTNEQHPTIWRKRYD